MKPKKLKQCQGIDCEQMFSPYTSLQKYCSPSCRPAEKNKIKKKRTKKKYKRKSKYAIAKSTVDGKWSKCVRESAGNVCEYCGASGRLNAHHIISRSNHATRFNLDNGVCLCCKHHTFSSDFSAHKNPMEFAEWIIKYRGQQWWDDLRVAARFTDSMNRDDANTMLTSRLKELQSGR